MLFNNLFSLYPSFTLLKNHQKHQTFYQTLFSKNLLYMSNRTRNASQSDEFLLTTNNKLEYGDKGLERSLSFNDLSFLSDNNNDGIIIRLLHL